MVMACVGLGANLGDAPATVRAASASSPRPMADTSDESLISVTPSLTSAGIMRRKACGRIT